MNNILVIEDNDADANLIKAYLKESNFKNRLFFSPSLIGGIDIIEDDDSNIDIVLLDLSLDDTSGYATVTSYLDRVKNVPVVVLTGNRNQIVGNQSVSAGAQDFLVKGDFNSQRLVNSIKYALERFKKEKKLKDLYDDLRVVSKGREETEKIGRHGSWEMDLVSKRMSWSNSLFRILDIPAYTFVPSKEEYLKIVHRGDKTKVDTFFEDASKSKEVIRIEHKILLKNKQVKTVELGAKVKFEPASNNLILYGYVVDLSIRGNSISLGIENFANENPLQDKKMPIIQQINVLSGAINKLQNKSLHSGQENIVLSIKNSLEEIKSLIVNIPKTHLLNEDFSLSMLETEIIEIFNSHLKNSSNQVNFIKDEKSEVDLTIRGNYHKIINLVYATTQICIAGANPNTSIDISTKIEQDEFNRLSIHFEWNGNADLFEKAKTIYSKKRKNEHEFFENHRVDLSNMLINLDQAEALIQIESKPGNLNHLSLSIPVKLPQGKATDPDNNKDNVVKILLVEDHFMRRIILRKELINISSDLEIEQVETGAEALKFLGNNSIDLVLMDLNLPDNESMPTSEKIINNYNIPVIGMTSKYSEEEMEKCSSIGILAYFNNENPIKDLFSEITRILL